MQQLDLPGGSYVGNEFDELARLKKTELHSVFAGLGVVNAHEYGYNEASQRTNQTFTGGDKVNYSYDNIGQLKSAKGMESDGVTPRLQEQFGYAYDAAWNLSQRTNNELVQSFNVNNRNQLSTINRSGTLTVAGTSTERRGNEYGTPGVTNVVVSGTGLSSGAAELYADGSWARAGAAPATSGSSTYTATAQMNPVDALRSE